VIDTVVSQSRADSGRRRHRLLQSGRPAGPEGRVLPHRRVERPTVSSIRP